jgi:deoxyadenosine/deoxycytidine kinase
MWGLSAGFARDGPQCDRRNGESQGSSEGTINSRVTARCIRNAPSATGVKELILANQPIGRIEISGGIASGKTTLAHQLVSPHLHRLVLEDFKANPFWALTYEKPGMYVAEKNICFIAQHTGAIKAAGTNRLVVCDFAVVQDLAYARLLHAREHINAMTVLYEHLYKPLGPATLLIHLECSESVQLQRIRARARKEEQSISLGYLRELNEYIGDAVTKLRENVPLHVIRSDETDFASMPHATSALKDQIFSIAREFSSEYGR